MLLGTVLLLFSNQFKPYPDNYGFEYKPSYLDTPIEYFFKSDNEDDLPRAVANDTFFDMVGYFPKCCHPNFSYDKNNRECLKSSVKILNIHDELRLDVNVIKCGLRHCEVIVDKYVKKKDITLFRDQDYTSLMVSYKSSELIERYEQPHFCLDNIIDDQEEFVIRYCKNKEDCFKNDNLWCLPKCCQDGLGFIDNECRLSQKHGLRTKNSDQLFAVKDDFALLSDMAKCSSGNWYDLDNLTFSIKNNGSLFVTDNNAVRHYEVDEYCLETASFTNSTLVKETVMLCDLRDTNIVYKTTPLEESIPEPPLISSLTSTSRPTSIAKELNVPEEKLISGMTSKLTIEKEIIINQTSLTSNLTSIAKETFAHNLFINSEEELVDLTTEDNTSNIINNTSESSSIFEIDKNWTSKQTGIQHLVSEVTIDQPLGFESPALSTPVNPTEKSLAALESVTVNDKLIPSPSDAMAHLSSRLGPEENLHSMSLFGSTQDQQVLLTTTSIPRDLEEISSTPTIKISEKSILKESVPFQFGESRETLKITTEDVSESNLKSDTTTESVLNDTIEETSSKTKQISKQTSKDTVGSDNIFQVILDTTTPTSQPLGFESLSLLNTPVNPPDKPLGAFESVTVNGKLLPSPSDAMVDLSSRLGPEENLHSISVFESSPDQQVLLTTTSIPRDLEEVSSTPTIKISEKSILKESFPSQFGETLRETLKITNENVSESNIKSDTTTELLLNDTTDETSSETNQISKQTSKDTVGSGNIFQIILDSAAPTSQITTDVNLDTTSLMSTTQQKIELTAGTTPEIIRSVTEGETSTLTPGWTQITKSKKSLTAVIKSATSVSLPASRSISENVEALTSELISFSSSELTPVITLESAKKTSSFYEIESTSLLSTIPDEVSLNISSSLEINTTFDSTEMATERNTNKLKNTILRRVLTDTHKLEALTESSTSTLETTVDVKARQVQIQEIKTSTDQSTVKVKFNSIEEEISESSIPLSELRSTSTLITELIYSDVLHDNSTRYLDTTNLTDEPTFKEFENITLKDTDKLETLSETTSSILVSKFDMTEGITEIEQIKVSSVTPEYENKLATDNSKTSSTLQMTTDALQTGSQDVTLKAQTEMLPVDSSSINAAVTTIKSSTEIGDQSTEYSVQSDFQTFSVTSSLKEKSTHMLTSVLSKFATTSVIPTETEVPILKSTPESAKESVAGITNSEQLPSSSATPFGQKSTEIDEKTYSSSVGFDEISPTPTRNLIEFSSETTSRMTPTAVPPLSPGFLARASEKMIFVSVLCYIITIIIHILIYQLQKVSERLVGGLCFVDLLFSTAYTTRMYVDDFGEFKNTFGYVYSFLLISRASWLNVLVYEVNYVIRNNRTNAVLTSRTKSMVFYTLYALLIPIAATVNLGLCAENVYEIPESFRPRIDERGIIHGESDYGCLHLYGPLVILNVLNLGVFMAVLRNFNAVKVGEYQKKNELILKMLKVGLLILVTAMISFCEYIKGSRRNVNMQSVEEINIVAEGLIFLILFSIRPRRIYDTVRGKRDYVINS